MEKTPTPKNIENIQRRRRSDKELIKGGAEYKDGVLILTDEQVLEKSKEKKYPSVEKVFDLNKEKPFPDEYRPWLSGWSFTVDEMKETVNADMPDGEKKEIYKMLTLDVSISTKDYEDKINNEKDINKRKEMFTKRYGCPNTCRYCFEKDIQNEESSYFVLTWDQNKEIIKQAVELGLRTIKFLGPGELVNDPRLFEYLDFIEGLNKELEAKGEEQVKFCIFTKPAILMNEENAKTVFKNYVGEDGAKVNSSEDLIKQIAKRECVRLLVSFTSADPQTEISHVDPQNPKVKEHFVDYRNKVIEMLTSKEIGFNKDPNNQRLAFICAPIQKDKYVEETYKDLLTGEMKSTGNKIFKKGNIDEAFDIFKWGVERNIPVVLAPTMISGGNMDKMEEIKDEDFKNRDLVELWADIYNWLIEQKIMTLEQIIKEGVAPYAGFACNQFITGMFIRRDGSIQACPGNETEKYKYKNDVREGGDKEKMGTINSRAILDAWLSSEGLNLREELIRTGKMTPTQVCYAKKECAMKRKRTDENGNILLDENGNAILEDVIAENQGSFPRHFETFVIFKIAEMQGKNMTDVLEIAQRKVKTEDGGEKTFADLEPYKDLFERLGRGWRVDKDI